MIKVVCVLKSGGDFDPSYVRRLYRNVCETLSWPFDFICYTDMQVPELRCVRINSKLKGWWSKAHVFDEVGPVLFLDLDTILIRKIDPLIEYFAYTEHSFFMLEAFNSGRQFASGIMAWTGDWRWLHKAVAVRSKRFFMDQDAIVDALDDEIICPIERHRFGIYSYKHHCRHELPQDARIVCFHGKPRPHEVQEGWLR